jgi:hypothetical protein
MARCGDVKFHPKVLRDYFVSVRNDSLFIFLILTISSAILFDVAW